MFSLSIGDNSVLFASLFLTQYRTNGGNEAATRAPPAMWNVGPYEPSLSAVKPGNEIGREIQTKQVRDELSKLTLSELSSMGLQKNILSPQWESNHTPLLDGKFCHLATFSKFFKPQYNLTLKL